MSEGTAHAGEAHIVPTSVYLRVFAALMVLLVLTCVAAFFDLGPLNNLIALSIAVAKAVLIVLYFMHLRYTGNLSRVVAVSSLVWLGILFLYTITDYVARPWLPIPGR